MVAKVAPPPHLAATGASAETVHLNDKSTLPSHTKPVWLQSSNKLTECETQGDEPKEVPRIVLKTMRYSVDSRVFIFLQINPSHRLLQGDALPEISKILVKAMRYNNENRLVSIV